MSDQFVLGIWDGHDAGAALLKGDVILFAVNEERLSRRKLDVGFPYRSIKACLDFAGITASSVKDIAASTSDPAKTLTRLFPSLKEEYYLLRRRKREPQRLDGFKKKFKYRFTEFGPNVLALSLSRLHLEKELRSSGFDGFALKITDHHAGHAEAAARCSGFDNCLVMTLDGVGDGLSGSLWSFRSGVLAMIKKLPAGVSFGIFFEHVTNLLNMRELEDEGKVMALANYAYPIDDAENPLMRLIEVRDLELFSRHTSTGMFQELKKVFWHYPSEQFAAMAQRVLEKNILSLVQNALARTGHKKIALSGGVFSNIKVNMKIAALEGVDNMFVFPHMGDGGLAIGAAMSVNHSKYGIARYRLKNVCLGPAYSNEEILGVLKEWESSSPSQGATRRCDRIDAWEEDELPLFARDDNNGANAGDIRYRRLDDPAGTAARLILNGEIVLWFQGRMEIGPRALGNRSILARPDDRRIKDRLNLLLKKRVWYQPFCPSLLAEDAPSLLLLDGQKVSDNPFMTTAFKVREESLNLMEGVINIDGTCRPHFVSDENPRYRYLLMYIKEKLGMGVVLNTSFNIHGEPMVCTPADAIDTLIKTGIRYLFLEDYLVENTNAKNL